MLCARMKAHQKAQLVRLLAQGLQVSDSRHLKVLFHSPVCLSLCLSFCRLLTCAYRSWMLSKCLVTPHSCLPHSHLTSQLPFQSIVVSHVSTQIIGSLCKARSRRARPSRAMWQLPALLTRGLVGLQGLGHTVAYCGDGINDIAALHAADLGIAIGASQAIVAAPVFTPAESVSGALHCSWNGLALPCPRLALALALSSVRPDVPSPFLWTCPCSALDLPRSCSCPCS